MLREIKNIKRCKNAFTLAEVLITLGIIGVVAALTIPSLIQNTQKQEWVSGVTKFYSVISQAVLSWKADISCGDDAYSCLAGQGLSDNVCSNFDQISKFLDVVDKTTVTGTSSLSWLPASASYYDGSAISGGNWGGLSNGTLGCKYLLKDGTTFIVNPDIVGFEIRFDVNGKKSPNRIGKDIFILFIGELPKNDVHSDEYWDNENSNLCPWVYNYANACSPGTINPTLNNGATPTSYVLLNKKIPDYYN